MQGQVAIVIGASPDGIGGASARQLSLLGATVVTSSRNKGEESQQAANAFAAKLKEETGSEVNWIPTDVTDENSVKALIDETIQRFGRIDTVSYKSRCKGRYCILENVRSTNATNA
ncbi:MAG: hypothetical protein A3F31_03455 [Candidatus Levybacteria bacterium RIFCSPHIGHO2_12_FULL_38_12]|nr:MAG: hypothetical protein A2770_03880 [Candidatus Levybacteria bacterium RIFCSPHIGHO2_01_FULL_38_12]OGH22155.1 MAG: hypothetical protein A3D75_02825 [Candidatus Levybacteria bacterium RIFCSPHIGHO2_02_FULL_37_18]OGH23002.1 MAG: hypothetical protein A3F31_03455 [Candidatus Levybacteria bacterium RIFCSPHIGHO2_12_FULL_38_12]OGH34174.1 MAG: hypothetical protein A3A47_03585 [Candidatus Levybacteria bacterium RIFCSPLOWO2_01_FULL_37_20]OGH44967.1 MAG: hypothetical protein A3J14_01255 [Candidatus Lev